MKFYSYEYLLSRIEVDQLAANHLCSHFGTSIVVCTAYVFQRQKTSKYRELSLIALLLVVIAIGVHINNYQSHKRIDDQYSTALRVVEQVSELLGVDKDELYINTQAARDGAIVKTKDDRYYRIISVDSDVLLEKMELYNPQIEIVDVEQK